MTDEADNAEALEQDMREQAERQIKRYTGVSAHECEGCGETIPEPRRVALPGVRICVDCQREIESTRSR